MSSVSLTQRLQSLSDSYKQTLSLIQDLQRYPNGPLFAQDADEKRLELANEIHQNLKEQEDSLELLKQETDEDSTVQRRRRASIRDDDRERHAATIVRLNEDIKNARGTFRRAQLQAKRNADAAKRKEREQLFAGRTAESVAPRRKGQEKLTQDELALNAADDVTKSLRRAHELLSGNIQQSQFAQQTLEESSEALRGLSESYGGTTDLLKSSKGLVGQLMRSQKSDTWFLISSWYILAATIAWLIFRRLLYGPLWWLVYQPLRLMWWTTIASLGAIGFGGSSEMQNSTSTALVTATGGIPMRGSQVRSMALPAKGGGWGADAQPPPEVSSELIEKVGQIIDDSATRTMNLEDFPTRGAGNTKKRMMELEKEQERLRDEL